MDSNSRSSSEDSETRRSVPTFVRWIVLIAIILLAAFLILLFARWIYHKVSDKSEPPVKPVNQAAPRDNLQSEAENRAHQQNSPAPSAPNPNTVPNSGPGNVIGVFAFSSLAAGGLHYIISVRRFNKSGV